MRWCAKFIFLFAKGIILFVGFNAFVTRAQSNLTSIESGKYELSRGDTGAADYAYYSDNLKRIYQGPFYFNSTQPDSIDVDYVKSLELFGEYESGLKNGEWTFSSGQLRSSGIPIGVTKNKFVLEFPASGYVREVNGFFDNGKAQGPWTNGDYILNNGFVADTTRFFQVNLVDNAFNGSFSGYKDNLEIKGAVNQEGFIDGTWVFIHDNGLIREERLYEDGVLLKHFIVKDGLTFPVKHVGALVDKDSLIEVPLSGEYLDILYQTNVLPSRHNELEIKAQQSRKIIAKSNRLLEDGIKGFSSFESIDLWTSTPGSSTFVLPKLKVKKYAYTPKQQEQLSQFSELVQRNSVIVNSFLQDPQVHISLHSNEEIAYYYKLLQAYDAAINKLKKINSLLERPSFEFVDRKLILPYLTEGIAFPDEVTYTFREEKKNREATFPSELPSNDFSISSVFELMKEIDQQLIKEAELFNPLLVEVRMVSEIAYKETKLLEKRDSIIDYFANNLGRLDFNSYHERYSEEVINYIEQRFSVYAKKNMNERVKLIHEELACYDYLIVFYRELSKLPTRIQEISELYTRTVWNPFTFTDMQEVVKEKVYSSYEKTLLPFVLNQLDGGIDCEGLDLRMNNLSLVFSKMKSLRAKDTQDLESKLKRTSSVQEVIEVFNLELYLTN